MFCCCVSLPTFKEKTPLVVDLKKLLCDEAWDSFLVSLTWWQKRFIKKENFDFDVPEKFFVFKDIGQEFHPRPSLSFDHVTPEQQNVSDRLQANSSSFVSLSRPEIFSLDTVFNNDTAESQMYHFRFEKSRRTEISVTFQKGFTIGGKANFSIGVPKIFSEGTLGAEIQLQYQVSKTEGQTFEETVLMEATSDITVGPKSCYKAKVLLEEKTFITDFTVVTRMEIPQGTAPVYINRKSDGELVHAYYVHDLRETFVPRLVPCVRNLGENETPDPKVIDFETKGVMKGSMASSHTIELTSDEPEDLKQRAQDRTFERNITKDKVQSKTSK